MDLRQKIGTGACYAVIALWILAAFLSEFGVFPLANVSILPAAAQPTDFEVRSRLLMEATNSTGACTAEDAARVWASGLKMRSAALQYTVMSAALKAEYARQLDQTAPNWVTGVSSPFVSNFVIVKAESISPGVCRVTLRFTLSTSTGPAGEFNATLDLNQEGAFWRITAIAADEALYPYTLFRPGA
jgi:hypothetical protein